MDGFTNQERLDRIPKVIDYYYQLFKTKECSSKTRQKNKEIGYPLDDPRTCTSVDHALQIYLNKDGSMKMKLKKAIKWQKEYLETYK